MFQQTVAVDAHLTIAEILSGAGTLSWLLIGLLIRSSLAGIKLTQERDKTALLENQRAVKEELVNSQTRVKEELVNSQTRIKEELVASQTRMRDEVMAHSGSTQRTLEVHIAQDEERFSGIGRTLSRLDQELDRRDRQRSH